MEIVLQIINTAGVLVASCVAIWGVNSWRRESEWKRKYELGEEVLALFYEAQDSIRIIRSPLSFKSESDGRERKDYESPHQTRAYDNAHVFFERYKVQNQVFNQIRKLRYRFMALFGKEKSEPFNELHRLINKIMFAVQDIQRIEEEGRDAIIREKDTLKELREVVYYNTRNDVVEKEMEVIIDQIEKIIHPVITLRK